MNNAIDHGVKTYSTEANTLIGRTRTSQEFENNLIVKALDTGALIVGTLNPGIGIAIGASKGIAYLNNMRVAERMNLSAEIANGKIVANYRRVTGRSRIR